MCFCIFSSRLKESNSNVSYLQKVKANVSRKKYEKEGTVIKFVDSIISRAQTSKQARI